jgi:hypothetical protein
MPNRRISLGIPQSPIDQKPTLHSRSFRKILISILSLSLVVASIHSITARPALRTEIAQDYLKLSQHRSTFDWLLRHSSDEAHALEVSENT